LCLALKANETSTLIKYLKLLKKNWKNKQKKNQPRDCDIDIIDFNGKIINTRINLPHPRSHLRNFVLYPLTK
jgi:2-amino-4-hydroxy-6-hydroxymethyldihydropteridine diphosphokinase